METESNQCLSETRDSWERCQEGVAKGNEKTWVDEHVHYYFCVNAFMNVQIP